MSQPAAEDCMEDCIKVNRFAPLTSSNTSRSTSMSPPKKTSSKRPASKSQSSIHPRTTTSDKSRVNKTITSERKLSSFRKNGRTYLRIENPAAKSRLTIYRHNGKTAKVGNALPLKQGADIPDVEDTIVVKPWSYYIPKPVESEEDSADEKGDEDDTIDQLF